MHMLPIVLTVTIMHTTKQCEDITNVAIRIMKDEGIGGIRTRAKIKRVFVSHPDLDLTVIVLVLYFTV
jgi:hypothetical protein